MELKITTTAIIIINEGFTMLRTINEWSGGKKWLNKTCSFEDNCCKKKTSVAEKHKRRHNLYTAYGCGLA